MYSYNPFLLPDTIAIIVPLVSLSIALWINHTWYKEVKHELHMRREKFKNQYWKTVSVRYMEIQLEEQCWEEEGRQFSDCMDTDDYEKHIERMRFLDGECHKFYYELVEVEKCMLQNKLIGKRERGNVLNRINHVNKNMWLHPCLEDGRWVTQYDYDGNININCTPHSLINGQSEAISSVSSHFLGGIKGYLFFEIGDANSSNFLISWDVPTIGSPVYSSDGLSEKKYTIKSQGSLNDTVYYVTVDSKTHWNMIQGQQSYNPFIEQGQQEKHTSEAV
nr:9092_t:CDS:2 [Entrophospora candida]